MAMAAMTVVATERMTMERAVSRQQIVLIRDWDAYQASLIGGEERSARSACRETAADDRRQKK
ncbi:MAG: hypothetical protein LBU39_06560 [Desulfobulbaceae bacterium]|nr:hypothetical protein [Desulfobulbaceae bacterium]